MQNVEIQLKEWENRVNKVETFIQILKFNQKSRNIKLKSGGNNN